MEGRVDGERDREGNRWQGRVIEGMNRKSLEGGERERGKECDDVLRGLQGDGKSRWRGRGRRKGLGNEE